MRVETRRHFLSSLLAPMVLGMLFLACKKESITTVPTDNRPVITPADFGKVVLTLTDYDFVRVTHQLGLDLRSQKVLRIGIGPKDSTGYTEASSVSTVYDPNSQAYIIHFDFSVRLDSSKTVAPLTLRYYLNDSTHTDTDTAALLYKYPYDSNEIILPFSVLQSLHGPGHFQDVDRNGSLVFFHPLSSYGLYSYDLTTHTLTSLFGYSSGDHVAADSVFVFCDVGHYEIMRFNLAMDTVDLTFPEPVHDQIYGMDVYNGYLYASRASYFKKYTLGGTLVDSVRFIISGYYLTIQDSIIYTVRGYNRIARYDMRTQSYLSEVMSPARSTEGIKISNGKLYYCDFNKNIVGSVPIGDLRVFQ
jgi:hypothetical protein